MGNIDDQNASTAEPTKTPTMNRCGSVDERPGNNSSGYRPVSDINRGWGSVPLTNILSVYWRSVCGNLDLSLQPILLHSN